MNPTSNAGVAIANPISEKAGYMLQAPAYVTAAAATAAAASPTLPSSKARTPDT